MRPRFGSVCLGPCTNKAADRTIAALKLFEIVLKKSLIVAPHLKSNSPTATYCI